MCYLKGAMSERLRLVSRLYLHRLQMISNDETHVDPQHRLHSGQLGVSASQLKGRSRGYDPKNLAALFRYVLNLSVSMLSLSDKSTADVVECADVDYYATGSFCSSCSIPPPITGGLWSTGKGCAMCDYGCDDNYGG